jgi:hypothetical protein
MRQLAILALAFFLVSCGRDADDPVAPPDPNAALNGGIDVRSFGAKGDGVVDDRIALQAAITAGAGAKIFFPEGTYGIGDKLTVTASNTVLRFARGAVLKAIGGFPGATAMIEIGNGSAVYQGIRVFGPGKLDGNSLAFFGVLTTGPNKDITVDGLEVTGVALTSINFTGVSAGNPTIGVTAQNNYVHDTGEGIQAVKATDVRFVSNRVEDITAQDCLEVSEVTRFFIANNLCKNPGNSNSAIDVFENSSDGVVENNTCVATRGTPSGAIGMDHNVTACKRVKVSNNIIAGTFGSGIGTNLGSDYQIINNIIRDLTTTNVAKGMEIKSDNVTIAGNRIMRTQSVSIHVVKAQDNVRILDNELVDSALGALGGNEFINIGSGSSTNIVIRGNRMRSTSGAARHPALSIANAAGAQILLENNDMAGIVTGGRHVDLPNDPGLTAHHNTGHITESSGTATIASGTTSIAVNHGLSETPSARHISVVGTNNATNNYGPVYITAVGATQFTINVRSDPGASTATFSWKAEII